MFTAIAGLAGTLISGVTGYFSDKQKIKATETEGQVKLSQAKTDALIDIIKTQGAGDIAWENTQIQNSGWKDEWWTVLFSTPLIMSFIPAAQETVQEGFVIIGTLPEWYQIGVGIAISAAFGCKKFVDIMALKNGVKLDQIANLNSLKVK